MSGRDAVLGKVRRALRASGDAAERRRVVAERLARPEAHIIPARGKLDRGGRVALFCTMAEAVSATVERLAAPADVPSAVAAYLRKHNLPATFRTGADAHIVAVSAEDIAGDYETVWRRIRQRHGPGAMPRTVNLVTGPSRSADIEQTLILGAHGPRALHILVVG
jgi:L-lactate dehydrogenase complex protein LldG